MNNVGVYDVYKKNVSMAKSKLNDKDYGKMINYYFAPFTKIFQKINSLNIHQCLPSIIGDSSFEISCNPMKSETALQRI